MGLFNLLIFTLTCFYLPSGRKGGGVTQLQRAHRSYNETIVLSIDSMLMMLSQKHFHSRKQ